MAMTIPEIGGKKRLGLMAHRENHLFDPEMGQLPDNDLKDGHSINRHEGLRETRSYKEQALSPSLRPE